MYKRQRILSATHVEKSELLEKELAIFKAARKLKDKLGDDVIRQTIISHATSCLLYTSGITKT